MINQQFQRTDQTLTAEPSDSSSVFCHLYSVIWRLKP